MDIEQAVRQLLDRSESFARDAATFRSAEASGFPLTEHDVIWAAAFGAIAMEFRDVAEALRRGELGKLARPVIRCTPEDSPPQHWRRAPAHAGG